VLLALRVGHGADHREHRPQPAGAASPTARLRGDRGQDSGDDEVIGLQGEGSERERGAPGPAIRIAARRSSTRCSTTSRRSACLGLAMRPVVQALEQSTRHFADKDALL
jgi:hypothetical protein